MKKEDMYNAVSSISPDILDKADAYMATKKTSKTIRCKRWIAAAACFCLLIAGFFATKTISLRLTQVILQTFPEAF